MNKIKVNCKIPEDTFYCIKFNNQIKTVDSINQNCLFFVDKPGNYRITIQQMDEKTLPKIFSIILFIITLPLQGLFHILTFNTCTSWENSIRAYYLKAMFDISIYEDTNVNITIRESYYSKETNSFKEPHICVDSPTTIKYNNFFNIHNIDYQYYKFIKKTTAIYTNLFIILSYLLYVAVSQSNVAAVTIVSGIMLLSIISFVVIVLANNMKRKRLYTLRNTGAGSVCS